MQRLKLQFQTALTRLRDVKVSRPVLGLALGALVLVVVIAVALGASGGGGHERPDAARAEAPPGGPKERKAFMAAQAATAIMVRPQSVTVPGNQAHDGRVEVKELTVTCDPGERAVGGGTRWSPSNGAGLSTVDGQLVGPPDRPTGYRARGASDVRPDAVFTVQAVCMGG